MKSNLRTRTIQEIHIVWDGPFNREAAFALTEAKDYGVYQIYGSHPVYGSDVLLYIGKASVQTFGKRMRQHEDWVPYSKDANRICYYFGRLIGYPDQPSGVPTQPDEAEWERLIGVAESLLIHSHAPAFNSSNIVQVAPAGIRDVHIMNWDCYRDLLPEISGNFWSDTYDDNWEYFKLK